MSNGTKAFCSKIAFLNMYTGETFNISQAMWMSRCTVYWLVVETGRPKKVNSSWSVISPLKLDLKIIHTPHILYYVLYIYSVNGYVCAGVHSPSVEARNTHTAHLQRPGVHSLLTEVRSAQPIYRDQSIKPAYRDQECTAHLKRPGVHSPPTETRSAEPICRGQEFIAHLQRPKGDIECSVLSLHLIPWDITSHCT